MLKRKPVNGIRKKDRDSKITKSGTTSSFKINLVLKEKYENENKKKRNSPSEQSNKKRKRTILYNDESGEKKKIRRDKKNLEALEKSNQETKQDMEDLKEKVKTLEKALEKSNQKSKEDTKKMKHFKKIMKLMNRL